MRFIFDQKCIRLRLHNSEQILQPRSQKQIKDSVVKLTELNIQNTKSDIQMNNYLLKQIVKYELGKLNLSGILVIG